MYDGPMIQNSNEYETMKRASFSTLYVYVHLVIVKLMMPQN